MSGTVAVGGTWTSRRAKNRGDHEQERDAVEAEAHHHPDGGEGRAGHHRADDAGEIELDGVEGDGVGQVFLADEGGNQGLIRRPAEGLRTARDTRQRQDVPDLHDVEEDQRGQDERRRHLHDLRDQHHVAPIAAIGDDAANEREQQDRQLAEKAVEAEKERRARAGEGDDQPGLRHFLHPRADARREGAGPEQPEVAVGEGRGQAARGGDQMRLQIASILMHAAHEWRAGRSSDARPSRPAGQQVRPQIAGLCQTFAHVSERERLRVHHLRSRSRPTCRARTPGRRGAPGRCRARQRWRRRGCARCRSGSGRRGRPC